MAYAAFLGFYKGALKKLHWTPAQLVAEANALFLALGLNEVPILQRKTVGDCDALSLSVYYVRLFIVG
jgi:hypothetical protein